MTKSATQARTKRRTRRSVLASVWLRVERAVEKRLMEGAPRGEALGVELRAFTLPAGMEALFFARVRRALELIDRYDRRQLARIRRDIPRIIGIAGGPHHYDRNTKTIVLSWPFVLQGTAATLAMTIIHEATHHRIAAWGVAYDESLQGRIEAVCVGQEAAFARRLPGGESLAEAELKTLEKPWWTPEERHRAMLMELRAHNAPAWALSLVDWIGRRRVRRARTDATAGTD